MLRCTNTHILSTQILSHLYINIFSSSLFIFFISISSPPLKFDFHFLSKKYMYCFCFSIWIFKNIIVIMSGRKGIWYIDNVINDNIKPSVSHFSFILFIFLRSARREKYFFLNLLGCSSHNVFSHLQSEF